MAAGAAPPPAPAAGAVSDGKHNKRNKRQEGSSQLISLCSQALTGATLIDDEKKKQLAEIKKKKEFGEAAVASLKSLAAGADIAFATAMLHARRDQQGDRLVPIFVEPAVQVAASQTIHSNVKAFVPANGSAPWIPAGERKLSHHETSLVDVFTCRNRENKTQYDFYIPRYQWQMIGQHVSGPRKYEIDPRDCTLVQVKRLGVERNVYPMIEVTPVRFGELLNLASGSKDRKEIAKMVVDVFAREFQRETSNYIAQQHISASTDIVRAFPAGPAAAAAHRIHPTRAKAEDDLEELIAQAVGLHF